jgi:fucose permease
MNYPRLVLAAIAAMVVFFIYGFLVHGWLIAKDYLPYPIGVYRAGDAARTHMPFGLAGLFLAILVFATIYAKNCDRARGVAAGALGLLFGLFMIGAFVAVNYATINISTKLALELAASEPTEWTLVGIVVSLVYKPLGAAK